MKKDRSVKQRLISAVLALVITLTSLLGTTFAWFTDEVTSAGNKIEAGNLQVDLLHKVESDWVSLKDNPEHKVFDYDKWEPGYTLVETLKVANLGSLALRYTLFIEVADGTAELGKNGEELADVIDVYVTYGESTAASLDDITANSDWEHKGTLAEVMNAPASFMGGQLLPTGEVLNGTVSEKTAVGSQPISVALHMQESAGNEYQKLSVGDIYVNLLASQWSYESDSFGTDHDSGATFPTFSGDYTASAPVEVNDDHTVKEGVTLKSEDEEVSATVPAGALLEDGVNKVTLTVSSLESSESNIEVGENQDMNSLDVHVSGIAAGNSKPILVTVKKLLAPGLNMGNYQLYHVENGATVAMTHVKADELDAHNEFTYAPATGDVTMALCSFSEVAVVADTENAWNGTVATNFAGGTGTENDPYIIANADQLAYMGDRVSNDNTNYGSAHYKLIADVNIGGIENYQTNGRKVLFYPIGYNKVGGTTTDKGNWYTYGGAFSGTFDGNGHTITGIYQNTWAMVGDYSGTYYNDAMGLFGYVNGGTVKNLTIDNFYSEGEFAPTGCVTAYAAGKATFENIAITNSHPQTYNTGVAGIIGWDNGGDTEAEASNFTFKNITVDGTNTVSALWGSWDVAAAGLLGYLGEYSKANFENCNVAATIDVYNDVCGNYQYYWYRYCGAFIGTVDKRLDNGKGALDLSNVTATNCTVNFGDRHEYYYCEFEKNSIASYTVDYQFSRVDHSELNMDANPVTCKHTHTVNEDKQAVYLPFRQLFGGYGWGVDGVDLGEYDNIEISDITAAVEKFETKFTGDFLYRVGNQNTVALGSLFEAKDDVTINDSGVWVTIQKVDDDMNVSGTYTANTSEWEKGTIQFSGTGVVKVTIQDYNYCKPTELYLEVVDAENVTSATSATKNNVVLLNDCGFSSLEVSGGYTLYGNGFTMTCNSDSSSTSFGEFVSLESGTLDNVEIICPNYDYAALYNSQLKDADANRVDTSTSTTRYYNAKSAVSASGNSQILNSRISGGRAALYVSSGNIVIDNSRIELGAVANIMVSGANSLVLRDATLIQKPTVSTYDSSKTLMGLSVLYLCDADGNATPTTLEGSFVQYAWADESCSAYLPEGTASIMTEVLSKDAYVHTVNGKNCVNLGFAYMPNDGTTVNQPSNISDNRTEASSIPYAYENVSAKVSSGGFSVNVSTYVYTYKNTNGNSFDTETQYTSDKYSDIISVSYSDNAEGLTFSKSYGTNGWIYEMNVDLDIANGYALDFSKLSMSVNGVTVTDFKVNGADKPTSPVTVVAGGTTYTLTATVNGSEYTATYKVTGTETSKDAPSLSSSEYESCLLVGEKSTSTTWSGAAPALQGIEIRYYSVAEKTYKEIDLSTLTPSTVGKQNGTNAYWDYSASNGDYSLTITNTSAVHDGKSIYAMPVVCNSKLYFVITSSDGLVSTSSGSRSITLKYVFKDNNGGELEFTNTFSVTYDSNTTLYDYSDFCGGTLNEASSCITAGTLITLADGTQKPVEELNVGDMVLAFNHVSGKFEATPVIFNTHVDDVEPREYDVLHLQFSNGEELKIVESHGLFDMTLMKYVYVDYENYGDFIGHQFFYAGSDGTSSEHVTLEEAYIETEITRVFCPVTYFHMNSIANGFLNAPNSPYGIAGPVNYFDYDSDLKYNEEAMQRDIEKYGLYTYDDFREYISEEAYNSSTAVYLKVAEGKGLITFEEILIVIEYLQEGSLIN